MLENQLIPTSRIGLSTIAESPIDWDIVYPGSEISFNLTLRETYEPRPHQVMAIDKTLAGFQIHDRGKLIMACGTGKTFTALRLAEQFAEKKGGWLSNAWLPRAQTQAVWPLLTYALRSHKHYISVSRRLHDLPKPLLCRDKMSRDSGNL